MASIRVKLVRSGVKELLLSGPMAAAMQIRAERVAAEIRRTAPVVTGNYRDHVFARTHKGPTRYTGQAGSSVDYAAQVEARHRTMGRSVNAAGG
jgi:hypothetical protein